VGWTELLATEQMTLECPLAGSFRMGYPVTGSM